MSATEQPGPVYKYAATMSRVIDGDSYFVKIDFGFRTYADQPVRLRGVNCPELGTPEGDAAKLYVIDSTLLRPLVLESFKDRQSFARWICDIWVARDVGWESLAESIIENGHGEPA